MLAILAEWQADAARARQEGIDALVAAIAAHVDEHRIEGAAGAIRSRHVACFHVTADRPSSNRSVGLMPTE